MTAIDTVADSFIETAAAIRNASSSVIGTAATTHSTPAQWAPTTAISVPSWPANTIGRVARAIVNSSWALSTPTTAANAVTAQPPW